MKKIMFTALALFAFSTAAHAQLFKIGVKAGPNFSNFSGGVDGIDYSARTSFHAGVLVEFKATDSFGIQPELLYTSQGADVDGIGDFNLDYVSVPVMAKLYIMKDKLSIDLGPQFSFLVDEAEEAFENETFDFALAGGASLNVVGGLFVSARYTIGLTEASTEAEVRNSVFQASVGYMF
jgi:hypothetical protein